MQLRDEADIVACPCVNRDHRFRADLEIFPRPDETGINRPGCLSLLAAVKRRFKSEFDQRD